MGTAAGVLLKSLAVHQTSDGTDTPELYKVDGVLHAEVPQTDDLLTQGGGACSSLLVDVEHGHRIVHQYLYYFVCDLRKKHFTS